MSPADYDPYMPLVSLLLENGWASQPQIDRLRPLVSEPRGLLRALAEQNILSVEQITQIDTIQALQTHIGDDYRVLRRLGAGGMGTVYLAATATGERVALKVINPRLAGDSEFLGRFHRETKALVGLRHPHLANVIASGGTGSVHWIALEYVAGPSLATMLRESRALPETYVLAIVRQVAECLAYVSSQAGLVHRDVKPENVLIARASAPSIADPFPADDVAKLIDFGLVKAADDDEHLTQTGMTIGTPLYMSPEQVRGEKLDCRSDIYGLGATMYHLLTGSPPFRGSSPGAIMSAHLTEPVPDPGELVPSLAAGTRRLVTTAMAKSVDERYRSFEALIKDLDETVEELRNRGGGSSIKLLRKPLVIAKKPVGLKRGTDRVDKPGEGSSASREPVVAPTPGALSAPAPPPASIEDRIRSKHQERKNESGPHSRRGVGANPPTGAIGRAPAPVAAAPAPAPSAGPAASPARSSRPAGPATGALVKVATDKVARQSAMQSRPPGTSAAFTEDPAPTHGAGMLPWLILGAAVLGALGLLAYRMLQG